MTTYAETDTQASRVIYINSKDATSTFGGNSSDFDFTLEEPIVVPHHHSLLMSVYSAEIPYSFYNFQNSKNTRLDFQITPTGTQADYDINGIFSNFQTLTLPEGNYTATELSAYLTLNLVAAGPIYPLKVLFDSINMKFKFVSTIKNIRITMGLKNGAATGTPQYPGDDMNEELGFDWSGIQGDPYVELNNLANQWSNGYTNPTPGFAGPGFDIPYGPFFKETFLYSDDVADLTNSIRSLFIRTNLSTTSVLDSHIGGGFSNILTRIPINTHPGGIINIQPMNGNIHKLLLKVKAITNISIRLTNQQNTTMNLNGLNFDISLKLDFIKTNLISDPLTLRDIIDSNLKKEKDKKPKKKKEV